MRSIPVLSLSIFVTLFTSAEKFGFHFLHYIFLNLISPLYRIIVFPPPFSALPEYTSHPLRLQTSGWATAIACWSVRPLSATRHDGHRTAPALTLRRGLCSPPRLPTLPLAPCSALPNYFWFELFRMEGRSLHSFDMLFVFYAIGVVTTSCRDQDLQRRFAPRHDFGGFTHI